MRRHRSPGQAGIDLRRRFPAPSFQIINPKKIATAGNNAIKHIVTKHIVASSLRRPIGCCSNERCCRNITLEQPIKYGGRERNLGGRASVPLDEATFAGRR
jgi:hypothetical protein